MTDCVHRWLLPPVGHLVTGVCKFCGEEKVMNNLPPDLDEQARRQHFKSLPLATPIRKSVKETVTPRGGWTR